MTDKLFTQETPAPEPETPDQEEVEDKSPADKGIDPDSPLFKVGDREYNADQAMKKIAHAEAFIQQLMKEKEEAEEKAKLASQTDTKLEQALELLKQKQQIPESEHPSQETETVDLNELQEQLRKIAKESATETYQESEAQRTAQENLKRSIEAAKSVHGDAYEQKLKEKGQALGLSEDQIQEMASKNPALFTETFARKVQSNPQPSSTHSTSYRQRNKELELPKVTGYFHRERGVEALREAERMLTDAIQKGTYKPRSA